MQIMSNECDQKESGAIGSSKSLHIDFDALKALFENDPNTFWSKRKDITHEALLNRACSTKYIGLQEQIDDVCQKVSDPMESLTQLTGCLVENLASLRTALTYYHAVASVNAEEYSLLSRESDFVQKSEKQLYELQQIAAEIRKLQKELQSFTFFALE